MKMIRIKKIGVLSLAKVQAALMALFGLVLGLIYGGVIMLIGAAASQQPQAQGNNLTWAGGAGVVIGLLVIILSPFFYGLLGFITGALGAVFYNLAAGAVGGLEIELETSSMGEPRHLTETY